MEVRMAVPEDVAMLFELNTLFDNDASKEMMLKALGKNKNEIVCIAVAANEGVGYCTGSIVHSICYDRPRIDIESLYVRPEFRRKGIGESLMKCLEQEAKNRGICHFHLNTGSANAVAQTFYRKLGFYADGQILMEKTIG